MNAYLLYAYSNSNSRPHQPAAGLCFGQVRTCNTVNCCRIAAALLFHYCCTDAAALPLPCRLAALLMHRCCFAEFLHCFCYIDAALLPIAAALLLLHCCSNVAALLLTCCNAVVLLLPCCCLLYCSYILLYCCCIAADCCIAAVLLQCCCGFVAALLHSCCCFTDAMLRHCCGIVAVALLLLLHFSCIVAPSMLLPY